MDYANNYKNSTPTYIYIAPPTVFLVNPWVTSYDNDGIINFTYWVFDPDNSLLNCSLFIDDILNQTILDASEGANHTFNVSGISEGYNRTWSVRCTNPTNASSEDEWIFNVDKTLPLLDILNPGNQTYSTPSILVNLSASDLFLDSVWFFNGTANQTYTGPTYVTYSDGSHTLIAYANDSAGNVNITNVSFSVDITAPYIIIESPLNSTYSNNSILVNISSNGNKIWFFNGTANQTYNGTTYVDYPDGSHTLIAYANDTLGNYNSTNISFNVDTSIPTINIISPTNTTYSNNSVFVSINATDMSLDKIWFFNGTANQTYISPVYITYAGGSHTLIAYVNDTANNRNITNISFSVDTIAPNITNVSTNASLPLVNNGSLQNLSVNFSSNEYPIYVKFTSFDSTDKKVDEQGLFEINSSSDLPWIYFILGYNLSDDNYTLNMTIHDQAQNNFTYNLGTYEVDGSPPNLTINTPLN